MISRHKSPPSFRSWRRWLWLSVAAAVTASLIFVVPADATGPAQSGPGGITQGASSVLISAAPANFRLQLQNYLKAAAVDVKSYPALAKFAGLTNQVSLGQKLLAAATPADLNAINSALKQMPNWQKSTSKFALAGRFYNDAHRFLTAGVQRRVINHEVGSNCPASGDTAPVIIAAAAAYAIAFIAYGLFARSISIVAGGPLFAEGFTLPLSPIRIIVSIVVTVFFGFYYGAKDAHQIRADCVEAAHRDQIASLNQYFNNHVSNMQVQVAVTPIDTYHFLIATHENGQPININPATVQLETYQGPAGANGQNPLPLITNGQSLCGTPPTQFQCATGATLSNPIAGTDPGVSELTIPTSMAGTSYRLLVDDGAGAPNNHYGVAVFTPLQHS